MRPSPDRKLQDEQSLASGGYVGPAPGEQDEKPSLVCVSPGWSLPEGWELPPEVREAVAQALAGPHRPHFTVDGGEIA